MRRLVLVLTSMALLAVACAPSAPPPELPPAGCYRGSIPGGGGSVYFTGAAPTPWTPNFSVYLDVVDCDPAAFVGEFSAVAAASEPDALAACLAQTGKLTLDSLPVSVYYGVWGFEQMWMCFPWP